MARKGTGRNLTAKLLQQQGVHISEGSVGNIIREYKLKHEQSSPSPAIVSQPQPVQQPELEPEQINNSIQEMAEAEVEVEEEVKNSIQGVEEPEPTMQEQEAPTLPSGNNSKYTDDNIISTGSPLLMARFGIGQAVNFNSNIVAVGGPLSHFLSKTKDTTSTPSNSVASDTNNSRNAPPPPPHPIPHKIEMKDPETEDIDFDYQWLQEVEESQEQEHKTTQPQPQPPSSPDSISIEMDWDSEDSVRRRFWARTIQEKKAASAGTSFNATREATVGRGRAESCSSRT